MGGNGEYVADRGERVLSLSTNVTVYLEPGTGGGCVTSGKHCPRPLSFLQDSITTLANYRELPRAIQGHGCKSGTHGIASIQRQHRVGNYHGLQPALPRA